MDSFRSYMLRMVYKRVQRLGGRLAKVDRLIDWEAFRPIVAGFYDNKSERGGRPNVDEVVMVKLLVPQQWYGLSDPELERQVADRLSFQISPLLILSWIHGAKRVRSAGLRFLFRRDSWLRIPSSALLEVTFFS